MTMTDQEQYELLQRHYPRADRRDLVEVMEAVQRAATFKVVGERLLVRWVLAGEPPEVIERAELELTAQRVEAEHAFDAAIRRAAEA